MTTTHEFVPLQFPLESEEGWPPVSAECLPMRPTAAGFEVTIPPLFVKGLSVGDVIEVTLEPSDGRVASWRHAHRSGHSTVWLLVLTAAATPSLARTLDGLRVLGCGTAEFATMGTYSIDVPPTVSMADVDALLADLDEAAVAVAFPSLRGQDPAVQ